METNDNHQADDNEVELCDGDTCENAEPQTTTNLLSNDTHFNGGVTDGLYKETTPCTTVDAAGNQDFGHNGHWLFSQRWILAYMGLWLGIMTFLFSSNMSVAIVCMVKTNAEHKLNVNNEAYSDINMNPNRTAENQTSVVHVNLDTGVTNITDEPKVIDSRCASSSVSNERKKERAEFDWSKKTQSFVLSGYFYGYTFIQIPAGWMAAKFGGKRVVGVCMALSCLITLLTPALARTSVYLVVAARLFQGVCNGMNSPSYCGLVGVWALPTERSRFLAMCWFGQMVGAVLGYSTSGMLCAHGFDNGWASVFYVHGMICVLFVICWWYFVHNSPEVHPRISEAEKSLLLQHSTPTSNRRKLDVPWRHILTYRPIYIMYVANICDCWTFYLLFTSLPQFMKEVLLFDIQSNGLFSCLPFLTLMCGIGTAGVAADYLRSKNFFSITTIRKMFQVSAFIGVSVFIILPGFMTCDQRVVVIVCICTCTFIGAIGMTAGYSCNCVDIAPRYASVIFGISNTIGSLPGIIAPIAVAELTKNQTSEEWRNVFYISCSVAIFGAIVYGLFADFETAPWAVISKMELHVDYPSSESKNRSDWSSLKSNHFLDKKA